MRGPRSQCHSLRALDWAAHLAKTLLAPIKRRGAGRSAVTGVTAGQEHSGPWCKNRGEQRGHRAAGHRETALFLDVNGVQSSAGHLVHFCVSGYSYTTTISGEFRHDFPADQSQPYSLQAGRGIRAPQVCPALLGDLRGAAGFHAFVYAPQKRVPRVKTFPPSNHTATKVLTNACDWLPRCHLGGGGPAPGLVRTPTCSHVTKSSQGALGAQER